MNIKKLFMLAIGAVFLLTSAGKPIAVANEVGEIKENVTQQVMRLANVLSDEEETEDPEEIFSRAIEEYKDEFDNYIDITGLNVDAKESITLPDFDINYVAPTYANVMHDYQVNLESSLTAIQKTNYDYLIRNNYDFDRYATLNNNNNKYTDLDQFSAFKDLINSLLKDVEAKVEDSSQVGTVIIGNKNLTFEQVNSNDLARHIALVKNVEWTNNILLMRYVGKYNFQIYPIPVTYNFCTTFKTHYNGLSSYTWYQNTARNLILEAGSGVTTPIPEMDAYIASDMLVMKHFHNCQEYHGQISKIETTPQRWSHSFFGQLYYYPSSTSDAKVHPDSPSPSPKG